MFHLRMIGLVAFAGLVLGCSSRTNSDDNNWDKIGPAVQGTAEKSENKLVRKPLPEEARMALHQADEMVLYSLEPADKAGEKDTKFHGWKVLGTTKIGEFKTREKVRETLEDSIYQNGSGECFQPRHAISVTYGGKTTDLVICFECSRIYLFDEKSKGDKPTEIFGTTRDKMKPMLNEMLEEAGVELAKVPK